MPELPPPPPSTIDPRLLDLTADALLQQGFFRHAERLSHAAQALREGQP
jgi:hypothetical protein